MLIIQQLSITLPNEMANAIKAKVQAGEYVTESEVICDGLRVLLARDRVVESWLHRQIGPAYDALKADPASAPSPPTKYAHDLRLNTLKDDDLPYSFAE